MKRASRIVKALVSVAFLVLLFSVVKRGDLAGLLRRTDPLYFALSFAVAAAQISVACLKWKVLIDRPELKVPFGELMRMSLIGHYFSNLLPSNVGGDVVRSYYAGRRVGSQTHAAISVFMERFTGSLYMLLLVIVCPLLDGRAGMRAVFLVPAAAAAALLLAFVWLAALRKPLPAVLGWAARRLGGRGRAAAACQRAVERAEEVHRKLETAVRRLRDDRGQLAAVVALTALFYALTWLNVYWSFRTFGAEPRLLDVACVLPTAMLVSMVPVTLGSLGIAEGSYVFYFHLVGMDPASTLAMGLFLRFKMICVALTGLVAYLTHREGGPAAWSR
jgi:uncharacterized protein (TIRG00374 family)